MADGAGADGAGVVPVAEAAALASPVTPISAGSYAVAARVLSSLAGADLTGRTPIQFSTSTSQDAQDHSARVIAYGHACPDGAIMCLPDSLGPPDGPVLIGGNLIHSGDNVAAASTIDIGLLMINASLYAGVAQTARIRGRGSCPIGGTCQS